MRRIVALMAVRRTKPAATAGKAATFKTDGTIDRSADMVEVWLSGAASPECSMCYAPAQFLGRVGGRKKPACGRHLAAVTKALATYRAI